MRLLLKDSAEQADRFGHREIALCQSALFHLVVAYRLYLNEVSVTYKVDESASGRVKTVEELSAALRAIDKDPAEARELANLEAEHGTWLNRMLADFDQVAEPRSLGYGESGNLIAARQVAE
ncbi:MAG: DUF6586 family protein, partial [bacterium]